MATITATGAAAPATRVRILVVDDEEDIADILKIELDAAGFWADVAYRPSDALRMFRAGEYRMAIIDMRMPGMDGFSLYEKMREIDPGVKVCFMTAFSGRQDAARQRFPGLSDRCLMEKPATQDEILSVVKAEIGAP